MRAAALACGLLAVGVAADAASAEAPTATPHAARTHRVNVRVGAASSDQIGKPVVCVDVRLVAALAVESCGTGAELWHHDPGKQLAHLRATWQVAAGVLGAGLGRVRVGAGLAELQVGDDRPGLEFGAPDASAAGPEGAVQAQWLLPLGRGVELVANATLGLAYFDRARELTLPQSPAQPFASVEVGLGW